MNARPLIARLAVFSLLALGIGGGLGLAGAVIFAGNAWSASALAALGGVLFTAVFIYAARQLRGGLLSGLTLTRAQRQSRRKGEHGLLRHLESAAERAWHRFLPDSGVQWNAVRWATKRRLVRIRQWLRNAPALVSALIIGISAVSLITVAAGTAMFLVHYVQIQRLTEQNELLRAQTHAVFAQQEFDLQLSAASRSYDQIERILTNVDSPPSAQALALKLLPDAIRTKVTRSRLSRDGNTVERVMFYPNLTPLRVLLRQYMSTDRVHHTLKLAGLAPKSPSHSLRFDQIEALGSLTEVSFQLVRALHLLGPGWDYEKGAPANPSRCIWSFEPNSVGEPEFSEDGRINVAAVEAPPLAEAPEIAAARLKSWTEGSISKSLADSTKEDYRLKHLPTLSLAHIAPGDFRGFQASHLGWAEGDGNCRIVFPKKAELTWSHFEGANLCHAHLEGADLRWAHLEGHARFEQTRLTGADLSEAHLEQALLYNMDMTNTKLFATHLEGAHLLKVVLDGVYLDQTKLNGARIEESSFRKCRLGADFLGASLSSANMENTDCWHASFVGAYLHDVNLTGADLRGVDFAGAVLDKCIVNATILYARLGARSHIQLADHTFCAGMHPVMASWQRERDEPKIEVDVPGALIESITIGARPETSGTEGEPDEKAWIGESIPNDQLGGVFLSKQAQLLLSGLPGAPSVLKDTKLSDSTRLEWRKNWHLARVLSEDTKTERNSTTDKQSDAKARK